MVRAIILLLTLVAAPSYGYDKAQVEADAALIAAYEEENRIFKDLVWNEPPNLRDRIIFYSLQAADVYTTYRGIQYDCVSEVNPLLPEVPDVSDMVLLKTIILGTAPINRQEDMQMINYITGVVVINNIAVWDRARKRCMLR